MPELSKGQKKRAKINAKKLLMNNGPQPLGGRGSRGGARSGAPTAGSMVNYRRSAGGPSGAYEGVKIVKNPLFASGKTVDTGVRTIEVKCPFNPGSMFSFECLGAILCYLGW